MWENRFHLGSKVDQTIIEWSWRTRRNISFLSFWPRSMRHTPVVGPLDRQCALTDVLLTTRKPAFDISWRFKRVSAATVESLCILFSSFYNVCWKKNTAQVARRVKWSIADRCGNLLWLSRHYCRVTACLIGLRQPRAFLRLSVIRCIAWQVSFSQF